MLQLNVETLMIEYCAYSIVMNRRNSPRHMGLKHFLSAKASSKHLEDINLCTNNVKPDIITNTF